MTHPHAFSPKSISMLCIFFISIHLLFLHSSVCLMSHRTIAADAFSIKHTHTTIQQCQPEQVLLFHRVFLPDSSPFFLTHGYCKHIGARSKHISTNGLYVSPRCPHTLINALSFHYSICLLINNIKCNFH